MGSETGMVLIYKSHSRRSHLVAGVKNCLKEINTWAIIRYNAVHIIVHLPLSSFVVCKNNTESVHHFCTIIRSKQ